MSQPDIEELYQEVILDHYKHPRCRGHCANPSASIEAYNPLCGDRVRLELEVNDGVICDIRFTGQGCSISQAASSLMSELCLGKSLDQVRILHDLYESMILDDPAEKELAPLGDAAVLRGIKKFPARYRCALLCWQALRDAVAESREKQTKV